MSGLIVGLDIGATKTAIAAEPDAGGSPTVTELTSTGWEAEPVDAAAGWIARQVAAALPSGSDVVALGVGAQGCDTEATCRELTRALAARGLRAVVVNDAALLVPAAGLDAGLGVIAGTGAIAVGRDRDGHHLIAGGWGHVLGDDAGAAGLVREAARAALSAADTGLSDDGLLAALLHAFGVSGPAALARSVNDLPTVEHWATRASAVFSAADAGSSRAQAVIDAAADHLVELIGQLVGRGAVGRDVVAAGGVIVRQPRLFASVAARLAVAQPAMSARLLLEPPAIGALRLARGLVGPAAGRLA